jgi:thermitase
VETRRRRWRSPLLLTIVAALAAVVVPCSLLAADFARARHLPGRLVLRARVGLTIDAFHGILQRVGARHVSALESLGATVIEAAAEDLTDIQAALRRSGYFKSVERDYTVHIAEDPNDIYYGAQWGMPRIGVPAAWHLSSGAGVIVAVVDTGIDAQHPDLQGSVLPGHDFVNADADAQDDHGHGTRMSGIIGAHRNNLEGIAGVAPDVQLLPVKALDAGGSGAYSDVAAGIVYAVDQGARVVNLSLAGPVPSDLLQAAVDYASLHDVAVVAAAGNAGANAPAYPAATTGVVAVSAVDAYDAHPGFSNSGAWIAFAAPGVDIVTTTLGASYASSSGTSPAAAFGSAVFALLFAAEPALGRGEAIARVQNGAVDLGTQGWDAYFGSGRIDAYAALLPGGTAAPPPDEAAPQVALLSPAAHSLVWGMVPVDIAASDDVGVTRVELFIDNRRFATATAAPYQFVIDASGLVPGQHKLRAYAYDASENVAKTKTRKISVTAGTGLLVGHAVAKSTSLTISAKFALPPGTGFDPRVDDLVITLSSAAGTVLSATAHAGALTEVSTGKMLGTIAPAVPSTGSVRMATRGAGDQPVYSLKVRASHLSGMSSLQTLMNFAVNAAGAQLSQSVTLRRKGSALIYP